MPKGRQSFDAVHGFGARTIAGAAEAGVRSLVHVSAIEADPESDSLYAPQQGCGRNGGTEAVPNATIVRPSIVFGPEDQFFNRFGAIARMSPVLPALWGRPVAVPARLCCRCGQGFGHAHRGSGAVRPTSLAVGHPYIRRVDAIHLRGNRRRSSWFRPTANRSRARPLARICEHAQSRNMPDWLTVSRDQLALLQKDNVVSTESEAEGRP